MSQITVWIVYREYVAPHSKANSKLALISPIGREGQTLSEFLEIVQSNLLAEEVHILVTDKVTDQESFQIIEDFRIRYPKNLDSIYVAEPKGIASLYLSGYKYALSMGFSHFLEIDAGLSHDPNQIDLFRGQIGFFDAVFGSRFMNDSSYSGSLYRKCISKGGTFLARALSGSPLTDLTSGYQLFSRLALEKVIESGVKSHGPFFQTEMKLATARFGLSYCEVPITYSSPSHRVRASIVMESLRRLWELRGKYV